ncbi:hypothetical protein [Actinoplanes sp. L3-i22]|uniref:hypothetical protein n=1 Tax=Actinoplanes sp. L3-i22 TaxID=2836373 RepID=UPI001C76F174|nr:hypothetical protein [Actinoplanes sp. L3-i22]BCY06658.1 hypothetical protein L3i22_017460 [Actinoplanes sp. L3-i22]
MRIRRGGFRAAVVLLVVASALGVAAGPAAAKDPGVSLLNPGGDVSLLTNPAVSLLGSPAVSLL